MDTCARSRWSPRSIGRRDPFGPRVRSSWVVRLHAGREGRVGIVRPRDVLLVDRPSHRSRGIPDPVRGYPGTGNLSPWLRARRYENDRIRRYMDVFVIIPCTGCAVNESPPGPTNSVTVGGSATSEPAVGAGRSDGRPDDGLQFPGSRRLSVRASTGDPSPSRARASIAPVVGIEEWNASSEVGGARIETVRFGRRH